jgi:parvulin-like peptidyl-prolyl isomerase
MPATPHLFRASTRPGITRGAVLLALACALPPLAAFAPLAFAQTPRPTTTAENEKPQATPTPSPSPATKTAPTQTTTQALPAENDRDGGENAKEKSSSGSGASSGFGGFTASTVDGVLATVGEEVILLSDLQRAIRASSDGQATLSATGTLSGGALSPSDAEMLLEQLVNQKVLGLRVREMGIDVGEDELTSEITAFLKQQNIPREEFDALLAQEGETPESHREEFRNQLETQRFIGRVIRPLVTVTEDEVKNFYMQQAAATNATQKVRLRSLVLNVPTDLQESQRQSKQDRITSIRKEVDTGGNFSALVKLYSESPDALKTEGLLPPRAMRELPAELQTRLKDIKPGQVVGPLQLGSSVFFFEFLGFELDDAAGFATQKAQWEGRLLELKFKERLDEYVRAERTKVKVVRRPITFRR